MQERKLILYPKTIGNLEGISYVSSGSHWKGNAPEPTKYYQPIIVLNAFRKHND